MAVIQRIRPAPISNEVKNWFQLLLSENALCNAIPRIATSRAGKFVCANNIMGVVLAPTLSMFFEHMHRKQINIKVESSKLKIMKKYNWFYVEYLCVKGLCVSDQILNLLKNQNFIILRYFVH